MSTEPDHDGRRTALATGALLLLPALCCGLPLLITAGMLGTIGAVVGNPWVIGIAVVLVVSLVTIRLRRRGSTATGRDSDDDAADRTGRTIQ
ncbi:MAG TPA: hypothetical protein VFW65_14155 [Pseudonocardiaceae bacterium]|nr:hypothetical protein [Pseudonocardiaceae bacterium]